MKSAINLLKLVGFVLAVAWLCSCNGNQQTIKLIHAYRDSVGINNIKQHIMERRIDSLREAHGTQYPPGIGNMMLAKIKLQSQGVMYLLKIDSLKIELEK